MNVIGISSYKNSCNYQNYLALIMIQRTWVRLSNFVSFGNAIDAFSLLDFWDHKQAHRIITHSIRN